MRNGAEIWLEEERIKFLIDNLLSLEKHNFIKIDDEIINTADIVGIFGTKTMEEITRRKNGQWKCVLGYWHERGQECAHHLMPQNYANNH